MPFTIPRNETPSKEVLASGNKRYCFSLRATDRETTATPRNPKLLNTCRYSELYKIEV